MQAPNGTCFAIASAGRTGFSKRKRKPGGHRILRDPGFFISTGHATNFFIVNVMAGSVRLVPAYRKAGRGVHDALTGAGPFETLAWRSHTGPGCEAWLPTSNLGTCGATCSTFAFHSEKAHAACYSAIRDHRFRPVMDG